MDRRRLAWGSRGERRKPEQEPGCEVGEERVGAGQDRQG